MTMPPLASPPDPDRDRRRATILARVADPGLGQTPLQLPSVGTPLGLPTPSPLTGSSAVRTDQERRFERVTIPAAVLGGISLVLAIIVGVAMLIGWSGVLPTVLLIVFGVSFIGLTVAAVSTGAAARKNTSAVSAVIWQSSQPWLGPLAPGPERRLVGVACAAVARIAGAAAWGSPSLDDHRLTLDLTEELNQIDTQAYALAAARYAAGGGSPVAGAVPTQAPGGTPDLDPELYDRWISLVDHVAALDEYANSVVALGSGAAQALPGSGRYGAAIGGAIVPPELAEAQDQRLSAGAVRDEFATAHLQQLTADLTQRRGPG